MEAFGQQALQDAELAALQVYPAEPRPPSPFVLWWKNLFQADSGDAEADEASPENGAKPLGDDALDARAEAPPDADAKDLASAAKTPAREVDWRLRRELEDVSVDTRAEARTRHLEEVAALEERLRLEYVPEADDLAVVLENARRSRAYRERLRERLRAFIDDNRRAKILGLVRDGYLVTSTADEPHESAAYNRRRAASALLSGAQYVSSNALTPRRRDGYALEVPDAPIRCNVLVDPDGCAVAAASDR
jgi:hypothetical protein